MKRSILILLLGLLIFICFAACEGGEAPVHNDTESTSAPITDAPITDTETLPQDQSTESTDTEAQDTEILYSFPTDPALYEPAYEENYGLIETPDKSPAAFNIEGTLRTATGTSLNICIEYEAVRNEGEDHLTLTMDLAIEHGAIQSKNFIGKLMVAGNEYVFMSPFYDYRSSKITREWLCPVTLEIPCGYGESICLDIKAEWEYSGKYSGRTFNGLTLDASLPLGEKYANLKPSVSYDVKNILQRPELPEGCEVTSLAIVLGYLGFDVTHTYLADNYLEQGPVGEVSFYEMNLGNPRNAGKSWGCYSPVIVKTANKYLASCESYYRAYSYTGYDVHELYYQVSLGNPAIVWITMDFAEPYIQSPWKVNGELLYWKYPLHCVVLSGYDMEKGTVTITDPLKNNPVTVDMDKFELRYKQMESQAVVIKMSKEK